MEPTAVDRYGEYSGNYTSNLTVIYLLFYTLFGVPYLIYTPTNNTCVLGSVELFILRVVGFISLDLVTARTRTKGIIRALIRYGVRIATSLFCSTRSIVDPNRCAHGAHREASRCPTLQINSSTNAAESHSPFQVSRSFADLGFRRVLVLSWHLFVSVISAREGREHLFVIYCSRCLRFSSP